MDAVARPDAALPAIARRGSSADHDAVTDDLPDFLRARGAVSIDCAAVGGRTRAIRVRQEGALNIRFLRQRGPSLDGVLVNIAGGVAAGDRYAIEADIAAGAEAVLSTAAAEKIYRSPGAESRIDARFRMAGALAWLPQETILFDQARLRRRFEVEMTDDASLTAFEMIAFGRAAMGEEVVSGALRDDWRVRRGGRLVYADSLRLNGDIRALLARRATGGGAGALATLLYVAPDAEQRLDEAREIIDKSRRDGCDGAASAWNGLLAARWLAQDARALRAAAVAFLTAFRRAPLPRVWST